MNRHQFTRPEKGSPGDFQPFFDWAEPERAAPVGELPPEGLVERITSACEEWMRRGGVIVRGSFGVGTVNRRRELRGRDEHGRPVWGGLSGVYATEKYCCPLAPLLDGLPSRFNPVADFARVLGVDHFWVLGFIHGLDKTVTLTGRRQEYLEESLTYVEGREAGVRIAERFVTLTKGWEA